MSVHIDSYPNKGFTLFDKWSVNLKENVKSRLKEGEELTNK